MKQVEVQIMGTGYVLGVPEGGEARLQSAVRRVDAAMCRIRDAGKIRARDRIAVLAALNLAFELADRDGMGNVRKSTMATAVESSGASAHADARLSALSERLETALGQDADSFSENPPPSA